MKKALILAVVVVAGCSSSDDDAPDFTCAIGKLDGTWRVSYVESAGGQCGPVADEQVVLSSNAVTAAGATCKFDAQAISDDRCRIDQDYTCPLTGLTGTQRWIGVMRHTEPGKLVGALTLQAESQGQTCRSTYSIVWTRL